MIHEVRRRPIVERTMRAVYGVTADTATASNTPEGPPAGDDSRRGHA